MEQIAEVVGGGTPKSKESRFFEGGNIPWITPADLSGYKDKYISRGSRNITEEGLNSSSARLMPEGTVIFTSRAPIGYVAITTNEISTNQGFKSFVIKDKDISSDYVYWWLKGNKQLAESFASGTTFLELSSLKAKKLPIPIAPPEQQKRIVAKIEELFSHIDAGIKALQKAKQLLKQYRQSVLKAAVTGELTKEWREANKDKLEPVSQLLERILKERRQKWEEKQLEQFKVKGKMPKDDKWKEKYKEPKLPNINHEIKLPDNWCWVSGDQSASKIVDGTHHTPKYIDSGIPFISVKDIRDDAIHFENTKFIARETHEKLIERCNPEKNDLLITKSGTIGRTAIIDTDRKFSLFVSVALVKRITDDVAPMFFRLMYDFYIQSIDIQQVVKGGMIKNLHLEDMRVVGLPLAPTLEQNIIVEQFKKKVDSIKRLEMEISFQLKKSEKNKQSILVSAFTGYIS